MYVYRTNYRRWHQRPKYRHMTVSIIILIVTISTPEGPAPFFRRFVRSSLIENSPIVIDPVNKLNLQFRSLYHCVHFAVSFNRDTRRPIILGPWWFESFKTWAKFLLRASRQYGRYWRSLGVSWLHRFAFTAVFLEWDGIERTVWNEKLTILWAAIARCVKRSGLSLECLFCCHLYCACYSSHTTTTNTVVF